MKQETMETLKLIKPPFRVNRTGVPKSGNGISVPRDFTEQALNEKWERDFGEPMRWIKARSLGIDWIDCPKCKHGLQEGTKDLNYCPHCGQKLLPPEKIK